MSQFPVDAPVASPTAGLSRRDLLAGAGAFAAVLATGSAHAGDMPGHRHEDHAPRHAGVLDAANACLDKGQRCIAHCLTAFREGDTSLAVCASRVHEMAAVCQAFSYHLASNSKYVKDLAAVCRQVCKDCEDECRKHADKHQECKDCGEACEAIVAAIDRELA